VVTKQCKWVKFRLLCYLSWTGPSTANRTVCRPVGKPTTQVGFTIQGNSLKPVLCGKVAYTYRCAKTGCLASLRKNNYRIYRAVRAGLLSWQTIADTNVFCVVLYWSTTSLTNKHKIIRIHKLNFPAGFVYKYSQCKYQVKDGLWSRCLFLLCRSLKQIKALYVQKMVLSWSNDVRGLATPSTAILL
jgi:hypothetical protein